MLFKLVSDGGYTRAEIDGKLIGEAITGLSFSTEVKGAERHSYLHLDFDLTKENGYEKHLFEDAEPNSFYEILRLYEKSDTCKG